MSIQKHCFDEYSEIQWTNFLKERAYKGLGVNTAAVHFSQGGQCMYDPKKRELEITCQKGKTILKMDQLSKENDYSSLSLISHEIGLFLDIGSYSCDFNSRIERLAKAIFNRSKDSVQSQAAEEKNLKGISPLEESLKEWLAKEKWLEIRNFFLDDIQNMRRIHGSISDIGVITALICISNKFLFAPSLAIPRPLAFQIQCTAMSLSQSGKSFDDIPDDIQNIIIQKLYDSSKNPWDYNFWELQFPFHLPLVSKNMYKNIRQFIEQNLVTNF